MTNTDIDNLSESFKRFGARVIELEASNAELLQACLAASAYLADPPSKYPENRRAAAEIIYSAIAKAKGESRS